MSATLAIIDFEASPLRGYPIEVGVALWAPGDAAIRTWSALIRATDSWVEDPDKTFAGRGARCDRRLP